MAYFNNRFRRELPGDLSGDNWPRQVSGVAWSVVEPTPVSAPGLLAWSEELADELEIAKPQNPGADWLKVLAGNGSVEGIEHYAMAYAGHQFGNWAGQLGDGRAISLGERVGKSRQSWEMQLKGAGPTPYSRSADGRAVLRSSLREFICSEAMHHLGVPTTRALSLVGTGDEVVRDMFYDGNPQAEPGAIVCRAAPSFIRFGSFQLPYAQQDSALLKQLADFTIRNHFPQFDLKSPDVYADWYAEVCRLTARLMVDWQAVGFVHGVMNTDNMSIHGLTIDYGPYGWLEPFDPDWTPNTTDAQGRRYAYGRQPQIGQWNCARLGDALSLLVDDADKLNQALDCYRSEFERYWAARFAAKLGLKSTEHNEALLKPLFALLQQTETDYCLFFRLLANTLHYENDPDRFVALAPAYYQPEALLGVQQSKSDENLVEALSAWLQAWRQALGSEGRAAVAISEAMNSVNPKFVPRNYLAQQAIDAAEKGDLSELETLFRVLQRPYEEQPGYESYAERRPEWARHKSGCSALSCSS